MKKTGPRSCDFLSHVFVKNAFIRVAFMCEYRNMFSFPRSLLDGYWKQMTLALRSVVRSPPCQSWSKSKEDLAQCAIANTNKWCAYFLWKGGNWTAWWKVNPNSHRLIWSCIESDRICRRMGTLGGGGPVPLNWRINLSCDWLLVRKGSPRWWDSRQSKNK